MIQDDLLGDFNLADDEVFDVQAITDAMMTPAQSLTELGLRFFLNLLVCWIIVQFFYYRKSRRRDYYFTFLVFSSAMVLLLYMMGNAEVGIGLTLGLFAIFGVIRYRTETVPIREMTYLFVIIALAALNGLSPIYHLVGDVTDHPHYVLSGSSLGITALANGLAARKLRVAGKVVPFKWIRMTTDLICVLTGMSFGLMPGIGTLIAAFFMGPLIEWFSVHLARPLLKGKT